MGEVKELKIKNRTYYYFNDIDIKDFQSNLLKKIKGYIRIKNFGDCENIHSINPLYLIIYSATGYFKKKYGEKYLFLDSTEKYDEPFSGIISEIKTITGGKELFYEKNYAKIGVNTDDDIPLDKQLKFSTLTIIIRFIFQNGKKLCLQIHLDDCLYESI